MIAGSMPIEIPDRSVVIANYEACNRGELEFRNFRDCLADSSTTARFIHDPRNASFGGSTRTKASPKTRICPGAMISLLEQMLLLSLLLKNFDIRVTGGVNVSSDPSAFPLRERESSGELQLVPRSVTQ